MLDYGPIKNSNIILVIIIKGATQMQGKSIHYSKEKNLALTSLENGLVRILQVLSIM